MPPKKRLPNTHRSTCLPAGTSANDYEPDVLEAFERNRQRIYQRRHRSKLRHGGKRDVTFVLDMQTRQALQSLCKSSGLQPSELVSKMIREVHEACTKAPLPPHPNT